MKDHRLDQWINDKYQKKEDLTEQPFEPFKYQRWKIHKRRGICFNNDDSSRSRNEKLFSKISIQIEFPIVFLAW